MMMCIMFSLHEQLNKTLYLFFFIWVDCKKFNRVNSIQCLHFLHNYSWISSSGCRDLWKKFFGWKPDCAFFFFFPRKERFMLKWTLDFSLYSRASSWANRSVIRIPLVWISKAFFFFFFALSIFNWSFVFGNPRALSCVCRVVVSSTVSLMINLIHSCYCQRSSSALRQKVQLSVGQHPQPSSLWLVSRRVPWWWGRTDNAAPKSQPPNALYAPLHFCCPTPSSPSPEVWTWNDETRALWGAAVPRVYPLIHRTPP